MLFPLAHRDLPLVLNMPDFEWWQPEMLCQNLVRPGDTQPSKNCLKWILLDHVLTSESWPWVLFAHGGCWFIWINSFDTESMKKKKQHPLLLDLSQTQCLALLLTEQNCTPTSRKKGKASYEESLDLWLLSQIKILSDSGTLPFLCEGSNHEGFVKPECFTDCTMSYYRSSSSDQKL